MSGLRRVRVTAAASGAVVATAELADTPMRRSVGLLGRSGLAPGDGMLLDPCRSVHTWFMRFPIDVVFTDRAGLVLRVVDAMPPFRLASGGRRAKLTIELPAGAARAAGVVPGVQLRIEPA